MAKAGTKKTAETRKIPFWATVLTLIGLIVLIGLGTWQVQRLSWKQELLTAYNAELAADPAGTELTASAFPPQDIIKSGFAEGIYLHDKELLLGPRTYEGKPGYHVITPFETLDNRIILVNRGWVPLSEKEFAFARPEEPGIITGIARYPEKAGPFTAENEPDKNVWYSLDINAIAKAKSLEAVEPFVLYLKSEGPTAEYPKESALNWSLPNNHLSYALFWFTMAGVLVIIYILRFLRKTKS